MILALSSWSGKENLSIQSGVCGQTSEERGYSERLKGKRKRKAYLLFTSTKPVVILTSYNSVEHPELLKKLKSKAIVKFIAYEVSIESIKTMCGKDSDIVHKCLRGSEDSKILDYSTLSASRKFSLNELSAPIFHESDQVHALAGA